MNTTTDNFFASVRNGSGTSDPRVRYDRLSGRWFLEIINVTGANNRLLLAVSDNATISNATVWSFYFFNLESGGGGAFDNGGFLDYPTLGIDNNALYIGGNIFRGSFIGCTAFVVRKTSVLTGGPIVVTAFRAICAGAGAGPYTPQGVDNFDATATEGYFIGVDNATFGTLMMRRVLTPGGVPTISANISLTVPSTVFPQDLTILGSGALDTLDDRLFAAHIFKNKLTGVSTLWTAHNIEVDAGGVANGAGNRNGSRWYQIQNLTGVPALTQSGTMFDSAGVNPRNYWIPSVAMNGQGHMAIGVTYGGAADQAGVAVAGRWSSDSLGSTQGATVAFASTFNYTITNKRWGDYSNTVVDPVDDMTMWTFQEYCNAAGSWGVRVVQLRSAPPATPSLAAPTTLAQGASNVNVIITGTVVSNSGFFFAGAGFAPMTATVSGTGVSVNSVTFTDPTHVTLNLSATAGAAPGARNITITNPDGQSATGVGILTVTTTTNPIPLLTSISPNTAIAAGSGFTLTVNGSNFISNSVVRWNGVDKATTFVNSGQVTATIPASDIAFVGTPTVTVFNPAPGGGLSSGLTFSITPIELAPNAFLLTTGLAISGGLAQVASSDNLYLTGGFQWTVPRLAPNLIWEFATNTSATTMSRLDLTVEAGTTSAGLEQLVQVFNVGTGLWVTVDTFSSTLGDSVRTISITSGASSYLGAGGLVRIRTTFRATGITSRVVNASIDHVHYTIYP